MAFTERSSALYQDIASNLTFSAGGIIRLFDTDSSVRTRESDQQVTRTRVAVHTDLVHFHERIAAGNEWVESAWNHIELMEFDQLDELVGERLDLVSSATVQIPGAPRTCLLITKGIKIEQLSHSVRSLGLELT